MDNALHLPEPVPNLITQPFWEGCRERKLLIQRCCDCGKLRFYPTASCPFCACEACTWDEMSGRGRIYSWTRIERSADPVWAKLAPFVSAIVELEEQPHLLIPGLLVESPEFDGSQSEVEVCFEEVGASVLPRWRLRRGAP
jgi:uncharacterized protein